MQTNFTLEQEQAKEQSEVSAGFPHGGFPFGYLTYSDHKYFTM